MRRPACSSFAVIGPITFFATASGLIIENVRSIAMAHRLSRAARKRELGQREGALFPRHPVGHARAAEAVGIGYVPAVVAYERVLVGVARSPAELGLGFVDRDERVLGDRLVDPRIERR